MNFCFITEGMFKLRSSSHHKYRYLRRSCKGNGNFSICISVFFCYFVLAKIPLASLAEDLAAHYKKSTFVEH